MLKEKTYVIKIIKEEKLSLSLGASPHPLRCVCRKPQLNEHIPCVQGQMQREGGLATWLPGSSLWGSLRTSPVRSSEMQKGRMSEGKGILSRGSKEGWKERHLMKCWPVKSWRKQTGIFNRRGIHAELRRDNGVMYNGVMYNGVMYRCPVVHAGVGWQSMLWLQEFSLTRKWVSWRVSDSLGTEEIP